jgi:hypothetical protein
MPGKETGIRTMTKRTNGLVGIVLALATLGLVSGCASSAPGVDIGGNVDRGESTEQALSEATPAPLEDPLPVPCPSNGTNIGASHRSASAAFVMADGRGVVCGQVDGTHSDFVKGHMPAAPNGGSDNFNFSGRIASSVTVNGTTTSLSGSIPFVPDADYLFEIKSTDGKPQNYWFEFEHSP